MLNEEQVKKMKELAEHNYKLNLSIANIAVCKDEERLNIVGEASLNLKAVLESLREIAEIQANK